jgi:hypothetical protein
MLEQMRGNAIEIGAGQFQHTNRLSVMHMGRYSPWKIHVRMHGFIVQCINQCAFVSTYVCIVSACVAV